jgi:hypothetical protein
MAKSRSKNKTRLIEIVILVFVVVSVSLLAIQLGMNVVETLEQSSGDTVEQAAPRDTATPAGPTPTIDFSAPVSEMD